MRNYFCTCPHGASRLSQVVCSDPAGTPNEIYNVHIQMGRTFIKLADRGRKDPINPGRGPVGICLDRAWSNFTQNIPNIQQFITFPGRDQRVRRRRDIPQKYTIQYDVWDPNTRQYLTTSLQGAEPADDYDNNSNFMVFQTFGRPRRTYP